MTKMTEFASAQDFFRQYFPAGGEVLCAVSGGLDSMCLLDFTLRQPAMQVAVLHFNHQLRGADSDQDEAFVREYCQTHRIPFIAGRGDPRRLAQEQGLTLEEAARTLRYAFFEKTAQERGCRAVLIAHHADDNAETMLFHLLRGTGSAGLVGIPPVRAPFYRPFLRLPHEALVKYAAQHRIPHVQDATNDDPAAADRNRLRHQVLPVLKSINPRAVENMGRTAEILQREQDALQAQALQLANAAQQTPNGLCFPRNVLLDAPPALAERTVFLLMERVCGRRKDLSARHVQAVMALLHAHSDSVCDLPYQLLARWDGALLHLETKKAVSHVIPLSVGTPVQFGSWYICLESQPPTPTNHTVFCYALHIPADAEITVTAWQNTDRMHLPDGQANRSLKRLCAERHIPVVLRDQLPVVRINGKAAAVPYLGADQQFLSSTNELCMWIRFSNLTEETRL